MATKKLGAVALVAVLILATEASGRVPAPLVPTALVEDVKSTTADIEFMDYIGTGQVIKLQPGDVLVLSYLKSCEYETITGGTVTVGAERSEVQDGKIARAKVACDGGKIGSLPKRRARAPPAHSGCRVRPTNQRSTRGRP